MTTSARSMGAVMAGLALGLLFAVGTPAFGGPKLAKVTCETGDVLISDGMGDFTCQEATDLMLREEAEKMWRLISSGGHAYAFVTSETFTGALGGATGADLICQTLADTVSLPGIFKAWIGVPNNYPAREGGGGFNRIAHYRLPPGPEGSNRFDELIVAADGFDDLVYIDDPDQSVFNGPNNPINRTENGETISVPSFVWTNVDFSGDFEVAFNCADWTSDSSGSFGSLGDETVVNFDDWTLNGAVDRCNVPHRLYCFGQ